MYMFVCTCIHCRNITYTNIGICAIQYHSSYFLFVSTQMCSFLWKEFVETQLEYIFIIIWHYIHVAHYCDKKASHKNIKYILY